MTTIYSQGQKALSLADRILDLTEQPKPDQAALDEIYAAVDDLFRSMPDQPATGAPLRDSVLSVTAAIRQTAGSANLESAPKVASREFTKSKREALIRECRLLRALLAEDLRS